MFTEETAGPGLWKSAIVGMAGVWLIAASFIGPTWFMVYNNWLVGFVAAMAALAMSGNRRWERPIAGGLAIWLFVSGFVPSALTGQALHVNELVVGVGLLAAAISANVHLRDDVRHHRPLAM
jgi:hypothetical protein